MIRGVILFTLLFFTAFTEYSVAQVSLTTDFPVLNPEGSVQAYHRLSIDEAELERQLKDAPNWRAGESGLLLDLPTADGQWHTFELWEAPIMAPGLADRFPMIYNLKGRDIKNPQRGIRLNYSPRGLFAVIYDNKDKSYIQPPGKYADFYRLYYSKNTYSNWSCEVDDSNLVPDEKPGAGSKSNNCTVLGDQLFTYRIVVATTGEFWDLNDGGNGLPDVLAALNDRLADMLIPYERDLSMTFELVDSNDIVMFVDSMSDPFSDPTNTGVSIDEAEATIEANFSDADYDIGHGYHEITCGGGCGWGGLAGTPVACRDGSKAGAYTFQPNDIATNTVFSHEFGHQLGCLHTIYGCGNTGCHRVEPGQGVTIMSTSAGCSSEDNYGSRVDFFHARSIDAILEYTLNGDFNSGSNCNIITYPGFPCVDQTPSGNGIPTSDADPNNLNLNIPISTPFFLEGAASDPDGDPWTANWVDYNSDPNMTAPPQNAHDIATAPLFRWFEPDNEVIRYFPQLSSILNGNNTTGTGEVLPSVDRTMDFRFIVRDNASPYGALACDELTVVVDGNSGPFEITAPNVATVWNSGDIEEVNWSVNNTNQAPISANEVDILLSTDGGQSFPITLESNVPNDGSHMITVPSVNTSEARIKVQPSGNYIFFDINDEDITITDDCLADGEDIFPSTPLQAEEGDSSLILNNMDFGMTFSSISDTLTTNDLVTNLAVEDDPPGSCIAFGSDPYHKIYSVKATEGGNYTFTKSGSISPYIMNLYDPDFVSSSVCMNWQASSGQYNGSNITISNTVSTTFNAYSPYELTFNGFIGGNTGTYSISASGPGDLYFPGSPLGGFEYEYIVVDDATGTIDLISAMPDLSSFSPGMYTVYGLSYDDSEDINSYLNGPFSDLESDALDGTICADLSSNSRPIEIEAFLPLDFLYFSAEKREDAAHLYWQIDQAEDVSHFEIERYDEKRNAFVVIGDMPWIEGKTDFEYLDADVQAGREYLYRIRSVDIDGSSQTTDTRVLVFPSSDSYALFPNPAEHFFQLSGPLDEIEEIRVINPFGQVVWEQMGPMSSRPIPTSDWPRSLYFVEIRHEDGFDRFRLVLQ